MGSEDTRCAAACALGGVGTYAESEAAKLRVVTKLVRLLKDESEQVRKAASTSLGKLGMEAAEVVPALIECIEDRSDGVREAVAEALGRFGPKAGAAVPVLLRCIENDKSRDASNAAANSLRVVGGLSFDHKTGKIMDIRTKRIIACRTVDLPIG